MQCTICLWLAYYRLAQHGLDYWADYMYWARLASPGPHHRPFSPYKLVLPGPLEVWAVDLIMNGTDLLVTAFHWLAFSGTRRTPPSWAPRRRDPSPLAAGGPDPPPAIPCPYSTAAMPRANTASTTAGGWLAGWGWDLLLGLIAAFYTVMAPYTKVEESFNVQVPVLDLFMFTLPTSSIFDRSTLAASVKFWCSGLVA